MGLILYVSEISVCRIKKAASSRAAFACASIAAAPWKRVQFVSFTPCIFDQGFDFGLCIHCGRSRRVRPCAAAPWRLGPSGSFLNPKP